MFIPPSFPMGCGLDVLVEDLEREAGGVDGGARTSHWRPARVARADEILRNSPGNCAKLRGTQA